MFFRTDLKSSAADLELFKWVWIAEDGHLRILIAEAKSCRALADSELMVVHGLWSFLKISDAACIK